MAENMEPLFEAIMGMPKPLVKERAPLQVGDGHYEVQPVRSLSFALPDRGRVLDAQLVPPTVETQQKIITLTEAMFEIG